MADSNSKIVLDGNKSSFIYQNFPLVILLCLLFTFLSVWEWYWVRVVNSADGFYGIFALISVVAVSVLQKPESQKNHLFLPIASFFTFVFVFTYYFLPPILRGVTAFTALSCIISMWRFGKILHIGIWSLFVLSLPSIASLQFFFGYPMRIMVGEVSVFLLKLNGLAVVRDGVGLNYGDKTIWIDAPCSGIKMLWAGFFLTALLTTIWRFNFVKSAVAFFIAFAIIVIGNIFRATGLFYLEAEIVKMPEFAHTGIGVVSFIFTCFCIVFALQKLRPPTKFVEELPREIKPKFVFWTMFVVSCFSAIYVQIGTTKRVQPEISKSIEFPKTFENKPLQELGLTEIEQYFMEDFPGIVKRFTNGEKEIIIRYVQEATRKFHSPTDCFAGNGYKISPLPLKIDEKGNRWGCFEAQKGEKKLKVCERIFNEKGENWTDVSAWYWSALSAENTGGYWAIATAENLLE